MSPSSFINHYVENKVGYIILNRPECKNAITTDMWRCLPDLLDLMCRNGAQVIVLQGAAGAFAAGADLVELEALRTYQEAEDNWSAISNALMAVAECAVPTIAAIDGACIGGGCLLAVACDLRYASERSLFGVPVVKLGIVLDDVTIARVVALVGLANARELLLRGHVVSAARALECGLINACLLDSTQLGAHVNLVVNDLLENSLRSMEAARNSLARVSGLNAFPSMEDPALVIESYLSADFKERVARALGKRA